MNVHIYLHRVEVDEQHIQRKTVGRDQLLVGTHDSMVQVGAPYEPVVHEQVLVPTRFFGRFGLTYKTISVHVIGLFLNRHQFRVVLGAEDLKYALFKRSFVEMKNLLAVAGKRKENIGKGKSNTDEFINNVPHLGGITFKKISACGHIKKQILHCNAGAVGTSGNFLLSHNAVVDLEIGASCIFLPFCF